MKFGLCVFKLLSIVQWYYPKTILQAVLDYFLYCCSAGTKEEVHWSSQSSISYTIMPSLKLTCSQLNMDLWNTNVRPAYFQGRTVSFKEFIICDACLLKLIFHAHHIWVFPKIVVPQNGWFIMENPIRMDDLGGKPTIFGNTHILYILCTILWKSHALSRQEGETFPIIVTDDVMQDNWSHGVPLSASWSWESQDIENLLHVVAWKKLKQNKCIMYIYLYIYICTFEVLIATFLLYAWWCQKKCIKGAIKCQHLNAIGT